MRQKSGPEKQPAEDAIRDIRRLGARRGSRGGARSRAGPRGGDGRSSSQTPAAAFLLVAAQPDLQRRRPLDDGASALACQPEVRTCRATDRLSGRDRRDRRCGSTPASPRETARSHRAGVVDGAGRGSLPSDARRLVSRRCDFCRRDRRRAPVRYARQLMAFLGLVPAERSTGDTPARVSETLRARLEALPKPVRDIAWKAQIRLCARYRGSAPRSRPLSTNSINPQFHRHGVR